MKEVEITRDQRKRLQQDWSSMADEEINIQCTFITAPIFAFGSELAMLRLFYKFRQADRHKVYYSNSFQSWCFRLDPKEG